MNNINCLIDSREQTRISYSKKFFHKYNPIVVELDTGDYIFENENNEQICFEYKTMKDFIASVKDSRVFEQVTRMNNEFKWSFIVIEGTIDDLRNENRRRQFQRNTGKQFSLAQFYGSIAKLNCYTTVVLCHNQAQSFNYMENQALKIFDDEPLIKHFKHDSDNPALNFLAGINGIGYKTAASIVSEFNINSLNDLLNIIEIEDLTSIKGIGKVTAENIEKNIL